MFPNWHGWRGIYFCPMNCPQFHPSSNIMFTPTVNKYNCIAKWWRCTVKEIGASLSSTWNVTQRRSLFRYSSIKSQEALNVPFSWLSMFMKTSTDWIPLFRLLFVTSSRYFTSTLDKMMGKCPTMLRAAPDEVADYLKLKVAAFHGPGISKLHSLKKKKPYYLLTSCCQRFWP